VPDTRQGLAISFVESDRKGLTIHRGLGAVLKDHTQPLLLFLLAADNRESCLADLGDEEHHTVEDEEVARSDGADTGERDQPVGPVGKLSVLGFEQRSERFEPFGLLPPCDRVR
jgi:hypothetical protein